MFLYLIYRHPWSFTFFFFNDTATTEIYTLSLHDALPIWNGLEPLFELCVELFERGIFVAGLRGVKIESQDIFGVEAEIHRMKICYGPNEQTTGDNQQDRNANLRNDEDLAQPETKANAAGSFMA